MGTRTVRQDEPTTFEEVAALDPDSQSGELDAGKWVPVTKNTWRHGKIVARATMLLGTFADHHPGWSLAVGDPGTKLSHDPDTLRGPDVGIVRVEREPSGSGAQGWLEGAPDVAVEVLGDAQSMTELIKKALEYLRAGARAVWLVDPGLQNVVVMTPSSEPEVLESNEVLDGGQALPGFSCQVSEFFKA